MKTALLVPCYEPRPTVVSYLTQYKEGDFDYFLLVDDGSGEKYEERFREIASNSPFRLLSYPVNKGKGGALKTGIAELRSIDPEIGLIITCDSDGQHLYEDVLRVRDDALANPDCLVLGVREFKQKDIPMRSKFGNSFSAVYFFLATRIRLRDTQTGLRAIPSCLFDLALSSSGMHFEYEMNFLLSVAREYPLRQVSITTVYDEDGGDHQSHFRPIVDSFRVYRTPFLYLFVSLACFGLDVLLFHIFSNYVFTLNSEQQVFLSSICARVISGVANFLLLCFLVFKNEGFIFRKAARYGVLWAINLGLSSGLTYLFRILPASLTFLKVCIDAIIAIVNYFVNLTWVYARRRRRQIAATKGNKA